LKYSNLLLFQDYISWSSLTEAVESTINVLEVHGLNKCTDHGLNGFKRYIAMVVARNIQRLAQLFAKNYQTPL